MCAKYKTFKNWDDIDSEEYLFQIDNDRKIDDPELNEESSNEDREEFENSDDFHKYDDGNSSAVKDKINKSTGGRLGSSDENITT